MIVLPPDGVASAISNLNDPPLGAEVSIGDAAYARTMRRITITDGGDTDTEASAFNSSI